MSPSPIKIQIRHSPHAPPVASLFCANIPREKNVASVDITCDKECTSLWYGRNDEPQQEIDDFDLAKSLASVVEDLQSLFLIPPRSFCNDPSVFQTEVNHWLALATDLATAVKEAKAAGRPVVAILSKYLTYVDNHLKLRTYLVGHQLTLADIALYCELGKIVGFANLDSHSSFLPVINMKRWASYLHCWNPIPNKTMRTVSAAYPGCVDQPQMKTQAETAKETSQAGNFTRNQYEGKLPGAKHGEVVTRFPPEPSGYLHIGHAKAALLNSYYAKYYNGKLLVRFDDTNPAKEKMEFEEAILEDLKLLNVQPDQLSHTSDWFDKLIEFCETLIKKGVFYCDDTPLEQMRQERGEGVPSRCRESVVEENLRRWEEMKKGSEEGLRNCVRARIDMESKNKCMRDPVMYRCIVDVPHHIHGTKYKVYPMYDFACPIVDSLEGVTHAMRTNEYADRIPQYQWVIEACGIRPVTIYEFSRLNLVNTVLSKRKLQWLVDTGAVDSWEDPRFPTVRGIRRRGLTAEALMEFILEQGPSKNINLMEWDKLWTKNKQILDPIVPRFMCVDETQSIPASISNGPAVPETKPRDLHPKNPSVGQGIQIYGSEILLEAEDVEMMEEGEEITLMRWCNAVVEKMEKSEDGKTVKLTMRLNPDGDFKKTKKKVHWVSVTKPLVPTRVVLREFDNLITKRKPDEDDQLEDIVNRHSVHDTFCLADPGVDGLKIDDIIQFERRGYFRIDKLAEGSNPTVFIKIPDGKAKAMSVVQPKVDSCRLTKGT